MDKLIQETFAPTHIIMWTLATFLIAFVILMKFAWPQIIAALEAREQSIQNDLDNARKQREEAEGFLNEHKKLMTEVDDKIRSIVDEAKRDADVLKAEIEKKAHEEAQAIRERSLRDIELAKDAAIADLRQESIRLSFQTASKVLAREIKAEDHKNLVNECLQGMSHATS